LSSVLPAILALAAVDAINPTSIMGALYLAGTGPTARLRRFILGVYSTYLATGIALTFGPAAALRSALGPTPSAVAPILTAAVGLLLVGLGIRAWRCRDLARPRVAPAQPRSGRSGLVLGFVATLADLPTAGPLLVATALLAGVSGAERLTGLALYNAVYISPLLAIALARRGVKRTAASRRSATV
jgi:hypothetical protein